MSDKYEREIEEILRKMSFETSKRKHSPRHPGNLAGTWNNLAADISPTRLYVIGLTLALLGFAMRPAFPALTGPLTLFAVVLLVGGFVISLTQHRARRPTGWRGRTIDWSGDDLWTSLRQRWDRWRRDRGWDDRRHR